MRKIKALPAMPHGSKTISKFLRFSSLGLFTNVGRWQAGSSLVLVVVIIASIIVIVFGASRLTLVQYNQANRDEDNIFALYAAKAAVEDGLARFRYNRDAETTDKTGEVETVQRFDLTAGTSAGEIKLNQPISSVANYKPTDQYYDMQIGFRGSQIGDFNDTSGLTKTLAKDDVIELTGFPTSWTQPYYLRYRFNFTSCDSSTPANGRLVQIQQVNQLSNDLDSLANNQTTVNYPAGGGTIVDSRTSGNLFISSQAGSGGVQTATTSIRLRAIGCNVNYALATSLTSNGDGQSSNAGPLFDNLQTTITATGYYGQAKRTLIANVDRISGRLINIYDFTLYSGTGGIKP